MINIVKIANRYLSILTGIPKRKSGYKIYNTIIQYNNIITEYNTYKRQKQFLTFVDPICLN